MTEAEIRTFLLEWYSRHGNINNLDGARYPTYRNTGISNTINFIFFQAFKNSVYPTVFGYYLDTGTNRIFCRHFYKSASEAAWRVGTGLRLNGSWVKSAENLSGPRALGVTVNRWHEGGGYIFEGMVNLALETELERYYQASTVTGDFLNAMGAWTLGRRETAAKFAGLPGDVANFRAFFINDKSNISGIVRDYATVRTWHTVIPPAILTADTPLTVLKTESVGHQVNTVRPKTSGIATDTAHKIKTNAPLWDFINECLNHDVTGAHPYTIHHDSLNERISIRTYELNVGGARRACIQIAESEYKTRKFNANSGFECSISSPICWVRAVYIGNTLSSYGNYAEYPSDLCFLVQKPMDYISQSSEFLAKRSGVTTQNTPEGLDFLESSSNINNPNIIKKGGEDTYLLLALFDEKYSLLIQEYKLSKNYPMFRWSSKTYFSKQFNENIKDWVNELYVLVENSCNEYLNLTSAQKKGDTGHHGSTGVNRVTEFRAYMQNQQNKTIQNFNTAIYSLFNNNRVGVRSFNKLFGGGINTNTYSYFTIFCRYILQPFLIGVVQNSTGALVKLDKGFKQANQNAHKFNIADLRGEQNALARIYFKAIEIGLNDTNLTNLTRQQSKQLLEALKNN